MKEQVSLRTLAQPGGLLRMLSSRLLRNWLGDGSGSSVPEGLTDRSLAIYCQGTSPERFRPGGNGMIRFETR
jgi:hypothetical protein